MWYRRSLCCSSNLDTLRSTRTVPNHPQDRGAECFKPSNRSQGEIFCFVETCKPLKSKEIRTSKPLFFLLLKETLHFHQTPFHTFQDKKKRQPEPLLVVRAYWGGGVALPQGKAVISKNLHQKLPFSFIPPLTVSCHTLTVPVMSCDRDYRFFFLLHTATSTKQKFK